MMKYGKKKFRLFSSLCRWFPACCLLASALSVPAAVRAGDFAVKAFHIDLRCEVMTMPALKSFACELAGMGINTLIMEWEAAFPYEEDAALSNRFAYSRQEVQSFVKYCSRLGIDVVPLQNCFGHVEYILRHDRYSRLREDAKEVSQVCPMKTEACKEVFSRLFTEMAALHPSPYFHIGGDETYLLGSCKACAAKVRTEGKSALFVDYVKEMCEIVASLGKRPVLWADIILKYPEALDELPGDVVFVDWNYGWERDRFGNLDNLLRSGRVLWGAPAIRSHPDNIYLTQWKKHFDNQKNYIPYARANGYQGMVMTSWSTSGTYGFRYDTGWEIDDMYPVRYVYPLSGFRMLVAAYGAALGDTEPLDPENFAVAYCRQRFGFSEAEGKRLWQILAMPQEPVRNGTDPGGRPVSGLCAEAAGLQRQMKTFRPRRNKKEFGHLQLMFDIRAQYLSFKEIEASFQSPAYDRPQAAAYLRKLTPLMAAAKKTDRRFIRLNRGFLYGEELKEINRVRNGRLQGLYEVLKRQAAVR